MSKPAKHHKRRRPQGAGKRPRKGAGPGRPRHFYDVRQYALLQDAADNLLILQLPKEYDEATANTWTLPGGKLEPADEPGKGLLREIAEETGLKVEEPALLTVARWSTRNSKKLALFYRVKVKGTKPELSLSKEHQRAIWISADEVKDFPFHREAMRTVIETHLT